MGRVHCCTAAGLLDIANGYPSIEPVACTSSGAVTALVFPFLDLSGSLASGIWTLFADTLLVLDMSGEQQPCVLVLRPCE